MRLRFRAAVVLTVATFLAGCSALGPAGLAGLAGIATMSIDLRNLAEPRGIDWQTSRINAPGLGERRQAFVDAQMQAVAAMKRMPGYALKAATTWGSAAPNWAPNTHAGVPLATFHGTAGSVLNGMACGLYWDAGAAQRYIYALSSNGYLLRIASDQTPALSAATPINLAAGAANSFKHTSVVLSPDCARAYCLQTSNGTLRVVDTSTMNELGSLALGSSAEYLAPSLDAARSLHDGTSDVLYVPLNNGNVYKVAVGASGVPSLVSTHAVATGAAAKTGCDGCSTYSGHKLAAPGVAYNGHYYVGDTGGVFHDFDIDADQDTAYAVSSVAGIAAAPALELQSGTSGALSQASSSATVTLPDGAARYAFVNVTRASGPACAWIDLARQTVAFSQPLYLDENDTAGNNELYGKVEAYNYSLDAGATDVVAAIDLKAASSDGKAATVATVSGGDVDLDTGGIQEQVGSRLQASTSGVGTGGSTVYFRANASSIPAAAVFTDAEVQLTGLEARSNVAPPRFYAVGGVDADGSTGFYRRGVSPLSTWDTSSSALDAAKGPTLFQPTYEAPPLKGFSQSNAAYTNSETFTIGGAYSWRVLDVLAAPTQMNQLALAMGHTGSYGTAASDSPAFDPSLTTNLRLRYEVRQSRPSFPVETAPLLDAAAKRCYVLVSNVLFCLKFDDQAAWTGTQYGTNQVGYQALEYGKDYSNNNGTRDSDGAYYRNTITPVASFNFKYVFALGMKKNNAGNRWHLAVSRVTPNNVQNGGSSGRGTDDLGTANREGVSFRSDNSDSLSNDPLGLNSAEASRFMMISPYDNIWTTGGDLYFALSSAGASNAPHLYRVGAN